MTQRSANSGWRRFRNFCLWSALAGLCVLAGLIWYSTTDALQTKVRNRLVAELEKVTGGQVELGSIHTIPFRLHVEVRNLTIHGREAADEVPYVHVDSLSADVKIISVLGAEFGFHSLDLGHPVIHIIVYPDGSTNQPVPKAARPSSNPVEDLFSLSISRLRLQRGELLLNDQTIPLDFVAHDVSAALSYSILRRRYEGALAIGQTETAIQQYRPFSWSLNSLFSLGANDVVFRTFNFASSGSKLSATGTVSNFRFPKIQANYELTLDARDVAAVLRKPEVRRGNVRLQGAGTWSAANFSSKGKLAIKDAEWRGPANWARNAEINTNYTVNEKDLNFSELKGRVLGGGIAGDATVTNWLASPRTSAKTKAADLQKGTVHLTIKDVSLSEIGGLLTTHDIPLDRLNLSGISNGTVDIRWTRSLVDSEIEATANVVPPPHSSGSELPVTARIRGLYRNRTAELQLSEFSVKTPASQIQASGDLSTTASLNVAVSTTNLAEWSSFLSILHVAKPLPLILHGKASFTGTATGRLDDPLLAGNLDLEDFDTIVDVAKQEKKSIHWDSLAADIRISQNRLVVHHGNLSHEDTDIDFDVNAHLQQWQFANESPFQTQIGIRNADAGEMLALAGQNYPVTGLLNLSAQVSGTKNNPSASGHIQLTNAVIYGEPVKSFSSPFTFDENGISFNRLAAMYYEATLTGEAGYSWSTRAIRADLSGSNFELARIRPLQASHISVDGRMDFTAKVSGTPDQPDVDGTVQLKNVLLSHEKVGNLTVNAATRGDDMRLSGQFQSEHAAVTMAGDIQLHGDFPIKLDVHFDEFNIHPFLQTYLAGHLDGISPLAGDVHVEGPLRHPRDLTATASFNDFHVDIENVRLHNDGTLRLAIAQRTLKIDQFRLVGDGTDLSGDGSVELVGDHMLDLRAQGKMNLKLIETYNSDFTSSGDIAVNMAVSGSAASPTMLGKLQISNGSIAYIDLPSALSDINGSIAFNRNRAEIETLTAHTGGGLLTFHGFAATYNRQFNFDLSVTGQDVRLRYPPGVSATSSMEVKFAGSPASSLLSGDVTVNKLGMTPGFDFGAYLERSVQSASLPQTNPLLNRIRLDVHIVTAPELQMQTAVVRLSGDADLHLRGTAARPVLLGRADVIEGEAYFNGTKYRLERGDVTFTSPVITTPVLDLQATTRIRDYDVTLNLNGEVDKLNITYRSEPPLPTADIIALLAFGQTTEESAQLQQSSQSAFSTAASSALINEALNTTVSNRVQRIFGVSRIKIDPQGLSTETSTTQAGPAVTIEQQVKNNLTITYTTLVSQASQQIIQVEYNLTRNVSIVGLRDQNGVTSFVAKIRRRKQ